MAKGKASKQEIHKLLKELNRRFDDDEHEEEAKLARAESDLQYGAEQLTWLREECRYDSARWRGLNHARGELIRATQLVQIALESAQVASMILDEIVQKPKKGE